MSLALLACASSQNKTLCTDKSTQKSWSNFPMSGVMDNVVKKDYSGKGSFFNKMSGRSLNRAEYGRNVA
jgi:hypothetical protein